MAPHLAVRLCLILAHAADRDWRKRTGKVVSSMLHKDRTLILSEQQQQQLLRESCVKTHTSMNFDRMLLMHRSKHSPNCKGNLIFKDFKAISILIVLALGQETNQ